MTHQIEAWNFLYKIKWFGNGFIPVRGSKMAKNANLSNFRYLDLDDLHFYSKCCHHLQNDAEPACGHDVIFQTCLL